MAYGQYSESPTAGRRWTLEEQKRFYPFVPYALRADGDDNPPGAGSPLKTIKRVGHNRALLTFTDGTQGYMLHSTVVAWRTPQGRIRLDSGGYRTLTTRAAMSEALKLWTGDDVYVRHDNRETSKTFGYTFVLGNAYEDAAFWIN